METNKIAAAVFESVRGYISKAVAPILERIEKLESAQATVIKSSQEAAAAAVPELIEEARRAIAALPIPQDGKDGESLTIEDIHPVMMLELSKWALDFERRAQDVLQRAIDRIPTPKNGKDGVDGLGFDDCDITYDGERGFTIKWQNGDFVKEKTFHVPTVIDRGYWREGTEAKTGDAMTHDGTLWIALRDTKAKPARESEDWRIGARKGRDGLQGPAGKDYKAPGPVKLGGGND